MKKSTTGLLQHKGALALVGILLLGSGLRFYGLSIQSLWNDELNSWGVSTSNSLSGILADLSGEESGVHPPGYYLLLHVVTGLIGESEWALRLPSAVAGVFSIFVIYLLGRRLFSYKEGLVAALLMAVLWTSVHYSQETRMYSLLILFTMLATYFWLPVLRSVDRGTGPNLFAVLGYVLAAAIAAYLHYFGLCLIVLQGAYATLLHLRRPNKLAYTLGIYGLIVLAYSPWLPTLFIRLSDGQGTIAFIDRPSPIVLFDYFSVLFNRSETIVLAVLALYAFLAFKALRKFSSREQAGGWLRSPVTLLMLWLVVPLAVTYIVSLLWVPILVPRYLLISLPAAYLLAARAFTQLPIRPEVQAIVAGALSLLFLSQLIFSIDYYSEPRKAQIREEMQFVAENERPASLLAYCAGVRPEFFDYYLVHEGSDRRFQMRACETEDDLARAIEEGNYRYVLFVAPREPGEEVSRYLRNEFELVQESVLGETSSYLFRVT